MADFRNLHALRDLIFLLLPCVGSRLEITKLASELKINRETVVVSQVFNDIPGIILAQDL